MDNLSTVLNDNLNTLDNAFKDSSQYCVKKIIIGSTPAAILYIESMVNKLSAAEIVFKPLINSTIATKPITEWMLNTGIFTADVKKKTTFTELYGDLMSGFTLILVDGESTAISVGTQGFDKRSISEPLTGNTIRGSRESFSEVLNVNLSLLQRRLKTPNLKIKGFSVGKSSNTKLALVYLSDVAPPQIITDIENKISAIDIDIVMETGILQPFLETNPLSLFSDVGFTERPDTLAAKLFEGRVGIILDGTPFAIIIPFLMNENFQTMDDYTQKYYYGSFSRLLKYAAFFISAILPGIFVAVGTVYYQILPLGLLLKMAAAEEGTPLPLMYEALMVYFIYEIVQQAGLNLSQTMGHAVSIVGAIVIGQAAVTAGIIGAPMVLVLSITVLSSFLLPNLFEATAILRFIYIIVGGTTGLFGVALLSTALLINITSIDSYGIPFTSAISPASKDTLRDVFIRLPWKILAKRRMKINDLPGADIGGNGSNPNE